MSQEVEVRQFLKYSSVTCLWSDYKDQGIIEVTGCLSSVAETAELDANVQRCDADALMCRAGVTAEDAADQLLKLGQEER